MRTTMKWKSELVWRGNRRVWKLGVRDTLLAWLGAIVLMLVAVGLIFLDKVRFVI